MSDSDDENNGVIEELTKSINKKKSDLQDELFYKACDDMIKKLHSFEKDIIELRKMYDNKITTKEKKKRKTYITKTQVVPNNICKLLNIKTGTSLSRSDVTKKIYSYIDDNNLHYNKDRRVLRADTALSNALDIPISVNNINDPKDRDNGFNIYNIQTYISKSYKANN